MDIIMAIVIVGLIIYIVYINWAHSKERQKSEEIQKQTRASYDEAVRCLVSCYLHDYGNTKKSRKEIRESCASAIVDAANETITANSYLNITDVLSMCTLFQSSFERRELDSPDGTIADTSEIEELEKIVADSIQKRYD